MTNPYDPSYTPGYASVPSGAADAGYLTALAICHYVWAGLVGFFGLFPAMYVVMGVMMLRGGMGPGGPPDVGWIFVIGGSVAIAFFESCAVLSLLAGLSIQKRRRHVLVMISAGVNCMCMPFGTVLGVFTFVVMGRTSVRGLFGR